MKWAGQAKMVIKIRRPEHVKGKSRVFLLAMMWRVPSF